MQSTLAQKTSPDKKDISNSVPVRDVKSEPAIEHGSEAGMPLFLQRSFSTGNSSPPEIQRKCDACATEDEELGSPLVQPSLKIGPANDAYEQEADSVSEKVVMMSRLDSGAKSRSDNTSAAGSGIQRKTTPVSIQRQCSACSAQLDQPLLQRKCSKCAAEEDSYLVQRKEKAAEHQSNMAGVQSLVSSPGAGNRLAPDIQRQSESVLNSDLSGVRVHSDSRSNKAAKDIGAKAFTHGNNVFLGEGESSNDLGLMSHELTHTVQQSGASDLPIQRYDLGDLVGDTLDLGGDLIEGGADLGGDLVEGGLDLGGDLVEGGLDIGGDIIGGGLDLAGDVTGIDALGDAGRIIDSGLDSAGESIDNAAGAVGGFVNDSGDAVGGLANDALDVGADFARNGYSFSLPDMALCPAMGHAFSLGEYSSDIDIIEDGQLVGSNLYLTGSTGIVINANPSLQLSIGPCRLSNIRITLDPFGRTSATATLSIGTGASLMVMLQAGIRREIGAMVQLPGALLPIPVELPLIALEGGVFGFAQASATQQISITPDIGFSLPNFVDLNLDTELKLGGALDLYAGAFGNIKLLDEPLCAMIWPFFDYHADGAIQIDFSLSGLWLGGVGGIVPTNVDVSQIPFGEIETGLKREPPGSNCLGLESLCSAMYEAGLMPSQSGELWQGHPTPQWTGGPLSVFPRDPSDMDPDFAGGAKCRGACGPDCWTCPAKEDKVACEPRVGENGEAGHNLWLYPDYQICDTHQGCRTHDACYDYCETGNSPYSSQVCHILCDLECMCNYPPFDCGSWVMGGEPHDGNMTFSDQPSLVSSCDIPCPNDAGGTSSEQPADGGGDDGGAWGGGDANSYSICLPTLELFGQYPWAPDLWESEKYKQTIWSQWIELPPPVFLANLELQMTGSANASTAAHIGPGMVNNVCFAVNLSDGNYLATGALDIEAGFRASLGLKGGLEAVGSWLGLLDVISGIVELEATGILSLRANLGAVLQSQADMTCSSGRPTLDTDLGFNLDALLDFDMDVTFRLMALSDTLLETELYSSTWDLLQAQWSENWGQGVRLNKDPLGDPDLDYRSHRFTLTEIVDLLSWLFSDDAEDSEEADEESGEEKTVKENPLTYATAKTIPAIDNQLDSPDHTPAGTVTLIGGASSQVGMHMMSRFISKDSEAGSGTNPRVQPELYGYGKLPASGDLGRNAPNDGARGIPNQAKEIQYVKGHLLNHHEGRGGRADRGLGGYAITSNLFPITAKANQEHNTDVEEKVKELVHDNELIVMYEVTVSNIDGPHEFDAFDHDPGNDCMYQYINATFVCRYATYRLNSDDTWELNTPVVEPVRHDFDMALFKSRVRGKDCPGKS